MNRTLVTAALPYANGDIHLGHLVEYLQADFWVRFLKMQGDQDVVYLCADDTHGTPVMLKAREEKISPRELIDRVREKHIKDFADFEISFDHYSSTNSPINQKFCEEFYHKMQENQHLVKKTVSQAYSEKDKMFLPDRFVVGTCPRCDAPEQYGDSCEECGSTHTPLELKDARSSISGDFVIAKESEHIFFQLETFRTFLKDWVGGHMQPEVCNKLNEWLETSLKSWDISRDAPYFGFPIPGYSDKYFYVWLDAPLGYIAATQEWCSQRSQDYMDYWSLESDAKIYHFIGKDIVYFHALFWPAMLRSAGLKTPDQIFVHGFLTVNGEKMSKSKGTFVSARTYLEHLEPAYLRYYFAGKLNSGIEDIDLNLEHFVSNVNSELIGKITNLGSRSIKMLNKNFQSHLGSLGDAKPAFLKKTQDAGKVISGYYLRRDFSKVIQTIRELSDEANRFFDEKAPWKTIKENKENTHQTVSAVVNAFRLIVIYLKPILPGYSEKVEKLFNENAYTWKDISKLLENHTMNTYSHLLQRLSPEKIEQIIYASKT